MAIPIRPRLRIEGGVSLETPVLAATILLLYRCTRNTPSRHSGRFATPIAVGRGYEGNGFQCPSETTSTVPSVTLMAVWSSMAYAGPAISAAHLSASAIELPGMPS